MLLKIHFNLIVKVDNNYNVTVSGGNKLSEVLCKQTWPIDTTPTYLEVC
jgi:hypothetical protein